MAERDYSLIAYGSDAHYAFTDYGKTVLENGFLDDFRRDDWNSGFSDYISGCEQLLSDRKSTCLNSSHIATSRMPSSA